MNKYGNIVKAKAIEQENKKRLLKINPQLNDESGIYILTRKDENGFKFAYIGQALHILSRLASHMVGYKQHIDLSLKKHKLYSESNPCGWKVDYMNVPIDQLDEQEKDLKEQQKKLDEMKSTAASQPDMKRLSEKAAAIFTEISDIGCGIMTDSEGEYVLLCGTTKKALSADKQQTIKNWLKTETGASRAVLKITVK